MERTTYFYIAVVIATAFPAVIISKTCSGPADIMFLLDDTDSTKRDNPSDTDTVVYAPGVQTFVQSFIDEASVDVRFALLAFSETCRKLSDLSSSVSALTTALTTFTPEYAGCDPSGCMEQARTVLREKGRIGVPQFIIILTDGSSRLATQTAEQARINEALGIDVIAVGFGNAVPISELLSYANDASQVFKVLSDTELVTLKHNVTEFTCQADPCTQRSLSGSDPGLYSFPGRCDKFIQYAPTGCVIRTCGYTTMWNNDRKVCDFPLNTQCDPCRGQPDGQTFLSSLYCNAFWECKGGVSVAKCCGQGMIFNGLGCTSRGQEQCTNTCS